MDSVERTQFEAIEAFWKAVCERADLAVSWKCEKCGAEAVSHLDSEGSPAEQRMILLADHTLMSPDCDGVPEVKETKVSLPPLQPRRQ